MTRPKFTHFDATCKVFVAQVAINKLSPLPPQGIANHVVDTPLHPKFLQNLQIIDSTIMPLTIPLIPLPAP